MAVTHIATSARSAGGTTTVAPAYPAGVTSGRLAIASRVIKPHTATGTAESGWTQAVTQTGGTASAAADVGQTRIVVDTRILDGSETGSVTFDNATTPDSSHGVIQIYDTGGGSWGIVTTTGDDTVHTTGRNATGSAIALAPGDVLLAILASDTDTSTAFTGVSTAISAPGITFGTTSQRLSAGGVTTGFDSGLHIYEATVSSGTASAAPSIALTGGPTNCGPVAFMRLRALPAVTGVVSAAFGFTASTSGNDRALGVVSAALGFTATTSGEVTAGATTGQVSAAFGFTAATAGVDRALGVVTSSFGFTAAPSGIDRALGQVTAAFGFTAAVSGIDRALGTVSASFGFAAITAGNDRALGVGVAAFGFTAATSGEAGALPVQGQAVASFGFTATAAGIDRTLGQTVAAFGFATDSAGIARALGSVDAAFGFAATGAGSNRVVGVVSAAFGFTVDADGITPRNITLTAALVPASRAATIAAGTTAAILGDAQTRTATIAPTRRTARIEAP